LSLYDEYAFDKGVFLPIHVHIDAF